MNTASYEALLYAALRAIPVNPPLSEEQIASVMPQLHQSIDFLGNVKDDGGYLDFSGKTLETARLLNISYSDYIAAALKQQPLFCQNPAKISANIAEVAALLGVEKRVYIAAALKQPPLFCQKPTTIAGHGLLMQQMAKDGLIGEGAQDFYLKNPIFLCLGSDNFHLRSLFARICDGETPKGFGLLRRSRKQIEADLVEGLDGHPEEGTGRKPVLARTSLEVHGKERHYKTMLLRAFIRAGMLKGYALGDDIDVTTSAPPQAAALTGPFS